MTMAIYRVSLTLKRLCLMTLSLTIRYNVVCGLGSRILPDPQRKKGLSASCIHKTAARHFLS